MHGLVSVYVRQGKLDLLFPRAMAISHFLNGRAVFILAIITRTFTSLALEGVHKRLSPVYEVLTRSGGTYS